MKLLFIGDIVGEAGREMVTRFLPSMRKKWQIDIVIANNENMAGGFGVTPQTFQEICQAGVDICTGGNHSFDKKEGIALYDDEPYCLRPANYPKGTPGKGSVLYTSTAGHKLGVVNLMGRTFMDPLDCPFRKGDELISELSQKTKCIFVDFHAEATSEKVAFANYVDGRVSAVVGTHTHVQSADERILAQGTGYLSDAGMSGPYDSVIGVKKEIIIERFLTKRGRKFETASGDPWLCGVRLELDDLTGKCLKIERFRVEKARTETHP